jgi:hypothetical protein
VSVERILAAVSANLRDPQRGQGTVLGRCDSGVGQAGFSLPPGCRGHGGGCALAGARGAGVRAVPGLPAGSLGRSRRWDFWVMLVLAVAAFGILLYAGTRSG